MMDQATAGGRRAARRLAGCACHGSAASRRQAYPSRGAVFGPGRRPYGPESTPGGPSLPARAWLQRARSRIPFRAPGGHVRPSNWTLPHGRAGLSSLWARRMAKRRSAAGGARAAGGRVAPVDVRSMQSATCQQNEPGTPVRRLVHVLELRRGVARRVSRQEMIRRDRRLRRIRSGRSEDAATGVRA